MSDWKQERQQQIHQKLIDTTPLPPSSKKTVNLFTGKRPRDMEHYETPTSPSKASA